MSKNNMKTQHMKIKRDQLVKEAYDKLEEATKLSDEIGEGFSWDLAYGMGGYYRAAGDPDWSSSSCYEESDAEEPSGEWVSSSQSC